MNGIIVWSPGVSLEAVEKQVIIKAIEHYRGNKTATAGALGISIRTLDNKLERYDADKKLEDDAFERDRKSRADQLARARGITPSHSIAVRPDQAPAHKPVSHQAENGIRVESASDAPAEWPLSVSERAKFQEVLSPKVAAGGPRGRR